MLGTIEGKRLPGTYAETFTTSVYTTRVIHKTLNPVWDESGYIVNLKGTSASIVLTLFDKDPAKSDFLGQVNMHTDILSRCYYFIIMSCKN